MSTDGFEAIADPVGGAITLRGEFDLCDVPTYDEALGALLASSPTAITVDVRQLAYVGSAGLGALIRTQQQVDRVVLRGASAVHLRLLEVTGVEHLFEVVADETPPVAAASD